MREDFDGLQIPPKTKKKIIGDPSDLLVYRPARTIKPSMLVKSPFLCKQHTFLRNDSKALDDLYQYTNSMRDKDSLR